LQAAKIERAVHGGIKDLHGAALSRYDRHNKLRGLAYKTRLAHLAPLRLLSIHSVKAYEDMTESDIRRFLEALDLRHSTLNTYKIAVKLFFKWLHKTPGKKKYPRMVSWIELAGKKASASKDPELLTPAEFLAVLDACTSPRDRALVHVGYDSAASKNELLCCDEAGNPLTIRSVIKDQHGIKLAVIGKTGERRIRLGDSVQALEDWLAVHPRAYDPDAPLWLTRQGGGLKERAYGNLLIKLASDAGVQKKIYPHLLRHMRLTELAKQITESQLRMFAGWSKDSDMPSVYVHLSDRDIDGAIVDLHENGSAAGNNGSEAAALREENKALRDQISQLMSQISDLMTMMKKDKDGAEAESSAINGG